MTRLLLYLLLVGLVMYFLWYWGQRGQTQASSSEPQKSKKGFRPKLRASDPWIQVFETASPEDAKRIQARLQEEEVECILYEQGRKDIHGNELPGTGIAVPKTSTARAQNIIARMPF